MATACIVCLGDLSGSGVGPAEPEAVTTNSSLVALNGDASSESSERDHAVSVGDDTELVAHLLPCGHNLHDDCLRPWVERANSCPICRASFNMVELSVTAGGPVISSYTVQDKQQIADIDPSMLAEDDDDLFDGIDPCMVCDEYGDEGQLLLCDGRGCDATCHVFCAGLDTVPAGLWFCQDCQRDAQAIANARRTSPATRHRRNARRRRAAPRATDYERVWQFAHEATGLDLDFPFDDDDGATLRRTQAERHEFNVWQRRFQIAARQGAATRFRDTAATMLRERPEPESQEELRAWNAFDKARTIEEDTSPNNRRKRKSATASPAEPPPEPERKLKRPRTRRAQENTDSANDTTAGPSASNGATTSAAPVPRRIRDRADTNGGPNFLQSLLREVEAYPRSSATPNDNAPSPPDQASSPRPSSPDASPPASNLPTPRALTPPPHPPTRPLSPPLTSNISPVFPRVVNDPAPSPTASGDARDRAWALYRKTHNLLDVTGTASAPAPTPRPRSAKTSPARSSSSSDISLSAKTEIQRMVSAALKPLYHKQEVSKDEYTDINRDVSRMLYDKVGDVGGLADAQARERLQRVASEEVESAVRARRVEGVGGTDARAGAGVEDAS